MKQRVLIVEDEEKLRRVVQLQLQSAGFDVDQAGSAEVTELHAPYIPPHSTGRVSA